MNRKEWKEFCSLDKGKAHYWYNKVRKFLKSKEFESDERTDKDAKVIHHLRDTEEQRKYNDEHYEMFGFEIDENGNEIFNYGKYVVFWTHEHHNEYHSCSEETKEKRSRSLKGIPRTDEWKLKLSESGKGKHNFTEKQRLQISKSVREYYEQDVNREKTSVATKEAMQRPEVRQHLIDGCKKKPPISKEVRAKASEANKAKPLSEGDVIILYNYFSSIMNGRTSLSVIELSELYHAYKALKISWNTFQKAFREFKHTLS